jgi:hypothetical protein
MVMAGYNQNPLTTTTTVCMFPLRRKMRKKEAGPPAGVNFVQSFFYKKPELPFDSFIIGLSHHIVIRTDVVA